MLFLLLPAGIAILLLIIMCPQVGLGLFIFSGRYSIARFEAFLGEGGNLTTFNQFRIAPLILIVLLLSLAMRFATEKGIMKISTRSIACLLLVFSFGLVLLMGCWYSPAESYGLEKALEYIVLTQFAFLAPILLLDNFKNYKLLLMALFLIPLMLGFLSVVPALVAGSVGVVRMAAIGGGPIVFGRFMAIGAFVCLGFLLVTRRLWWKGYLIGALVFLTVASFSSGSRGVIVAFVPSVIFYAMASVFSGVGRGKHARNIFAALVIVVVIDVFLFQLYPEFFSAYLVRYQHLWRELPGSTSISQRLYYLESALAMFTQQPLIGYGTGAYAPVALGVQHRVYPHNIFLEIAAETGILGLLVFGGFIILILRSIIYLLKVGEGYPRFHPFGIAIATCFIFYFIAAQFSGDLYDSRFIWFFGGMILALENIIMREKRALGSRTMEKMD